MFRRLLFILAAVLAVFIACSHAQSAVPSPSPSPTPCNCTCPPTDNHRVNLDLSHSQVDGDTLHCEYPEAPNQVGTFFCDFAIVSVDPPPQRSSPLCEPILIHNSSQTGCGLKNDHDGGSCPSAGVCAPRRRRNALPRAPYPPSPAARGPKPQVMKTRRQLGIWRRFGGA